MNVLSLFDGMSCGQIALNDANIKYDNYFASEIDSHAIKISLKNYPNTKHLGDVTKITSENLPKIDLLFGGSPCQSFSRAGDNKGFEGKSGLFWEFVRILKEVKPTYFLLENVVMKKEWKDIISESLGVQPIEINSNLTSSQNRKRLYWTNIPNVKKPEDKKISLESILQKNITGKEFILSQENIDKNDLERYRKNKNIKQVVFTERRTEEAKRIRREYQKEHGKDFSPRRAKELAPRTDGKCNCLTTSLTKEHILLDENFNFRKLTPIECERLQTIPDNYTLHEDVSTTQRVRMIGNGWTVKVISHIFSFIQNSN
jgi:DNA-cytosine methyltransferase